jgi:hemerythrin HHE cation binding domain-containing protein
MRITRRFPTILTVLSITITTCAWLATRSTGAETSAKTAAPAIPKSIQVEHEAIHSALVDATKAPGAVGVAAKELATVLHPHFVREEEIALPPLGLLEPLAAGTPVPEATMRDVLVMTDALKAELPRMLEEHKAIRAAVEKLGAAARAEKSASARTLAEELAAHARTEEEVLYPAAILVGDVIRARQKAK